jgi:aryl-alcohol dehydrogenase-like predicted oxidoreductase
MSASTAVPREYYRPLGRTGVVVSPLCLGCWQFGDRVSGPLAGRLFDMAVDRGINYLDTADVYGGGVGNSERLVGEALKRSGKRDSLVIATKAFFPTDESDPNMRGVSRRYLIGACDASLRRLGVDHIDVYYLHRPDPGVPADETLRALDDLIRAGKIRYVGTSTSSAWRLLEAIQVAKEIGTNRYVVESPPYSILDRRIERELIPMAEAYGVGLSAWSPLASGILSGIYKRGEAPPAGSRFADPVFNAEYGFRLNPRVYDVLERVEQLAASKGCTMAQFALAWVTQAPGIASTIIGPESVEDLESSLASLDIEVTAEDRALIDEVIVQGDHVSSFYEESPAWAQSLSDINGPEAKYD